MKFNRFRTMVVGRILVLSATIFLFVYLLLNTTFFITGIMLGMLIIYQVYRLVYFVEKTNRELNHFLQSIQHEDFTQTFPEKSLGESFENLKNSFNRISRKFLKLRSEKEAHVHYLQTVIKHVRVGLISYKANGDIELLNPAARELLNIDYAGKIKSVKQFGTTMANTLLNLKAGEKTSLKVESMVPPLYLSIYAARIKIKGESYTLVSLQDIQPEIEREHMAKELEIAWEVQKSLLPSRNPIIPGFDIAGICIPAEEVGGDYYDFIPLGKNKLAMIIGDVSGKGTSASFYMTLTKGFIQSHMRKNTSPKEVLIKVNELMYKTIDRRHFVTMFIAVLDWQSKKIFCARAGHNPAIHYSSKSGECSLIKTGGIALGLRETGAFTEAIREYELQLDEDDWFILYTDGFIEAADAESREFGEEGLIQAVKENLRENAENMVENIFNNVRNFSPANGRQDDMTMIGLKAVPGK